MRTMQMSQEYSSAQLTKAPLAPPIQGPYSSPRHDPFEPALWPRQEQLIICVFCSSFHSYTHLRLHSQTRVLVLHLESSSHAAECGCLQTVLGASHNTPMCYSVAQSYRGGWAEQTLRQFRPSRSSYYPPSPPILPFRFSSKSQWQSQPLHFSWPLKTKVFSSKTIFTLIPLWRFSVDTDNVAVVAK